MQLKTFSRKGFTINCVIPFILLFVFNNSIHIFNSSFRFKLILEILGVDQLKINLKVIEIQSIYVGFYEISSSQKIQSILLKYTREYCTHVATDKVNIPFRH